MRFELGPNAADHVVENVNGFGGDAAGGSHRRGAGSRSGMVGAEDESERVDQEEPGHVTIVSLFANWTHPSG